jgi:20S proteasome subunit beta 4
LQGPDFVLLCSDTAAAHSIISIKHDEDKLVPIDSHKLFAIAGEAGDRVNFSEYIIANVKLYALRNSTALSTKSVAHFTRGEMDKALRSVSDPARVFSFLACQPQARGLCVSPQSPYHCNLLLGGYDEKTGPSLFWMDYLGTLTRVNTGGTGYGKSGRSRCGDTLLDHSMLRSMLFCPTFQCRCNVCAVPL